MDAWDVLRDGFERVHELVGSTLEADPDLSRAPAGGNTPAWMLWHLIRVQDDHVADAFGLEQVWFRGWADTFALPFTAQETGYGMSGEDAAKVRATPGLLRSYHEDVHTQTLNALAGKPDLDRVVDERWDPPVTLGVRLVSVIADELQHLGQVGYVLGLPRNGMPAAV
jgi:hypothetical protein